MLTIFSLQQLSYYTLRKPYLPEVIPSITIILFPSPLEIREDIAS